MPKRQNAIVRHNFGINQNQQNKKKEKKITANAHTHIATGYFIYLCVSLDEYKYTHK